MIGIFCYSFIECNNPKPRYNEGYEKNFVIHEIQEEGHRKIFGSSLYSVYPVERMQCVALRQTISLAASR